MTISLLSFKKQPKELWFPFLFSSSIKQFETMVQKQCRDLCKLSEALLKINPKSGANKKRVLPFVPI